MNTSKMVSMAATVTTLASVYGAVGASSATEHVSVGEESRNLQAETFFAAAVGDQIAGTDFQVRWNYNNGTGGTYNKFFFNLFEGDDCGYTSGASRVATLCREHATGGCEGDENQEYNATLPSTLSAGTYTIKEGVFDDTSVRDCSSPFNISEYGTGTMIPSNAGTSGCDPTIPIDVRFSSTTNRIYFEHTLGTTTGGCATLGMLYETRTTSAGIPEGPIYVMDENDNIIMEPTTPTGRWYINADLYVTDGITFEAIGLAQGGDADTLRVESTSDRFWNIRGHGGSLYFEGTTVTSWDPSAGGPQENYDSGRSYISCISELTGYDSGCDLGFAKADMGECRMDILDSEMGYLGWFDSESYGLTWKVRGFCVDESNPEVFENVNVYGDIMRSDIHHMYYGMYSYGHQEGVWINNLMHDNVQYGFDPHDDSDFLTISDNEVYNNGNHGIIASKRCNDVSITNNYVHDGTGLIAAGIFLHRSSDNAVVTGNVVEKMPDAGIAIMESFGLKVYDNSFTDVKYGIRISVGGAENEIYDNVFDTCSDYGLYTYQGSDLPFTDSDGRPKNNIFMNNKVLNTVQGIKLGQADDTIFEGNEFSAETTLFEFQDSYETLFIDNIYEAGVEFDTSSTDYQSCFAAGSQAGAEPVC